MTSEALTASLRVYFARMAASAAWATPWVARDARGCILGWQVAPTGAALRRRFRSADVRRERHHADARAHTQDLTPSPESR